MTPGPRRRRRRARSQGRRRCRPGLAAAWSPAAWPHRPQRALWPGCALSSRSPLRMAGSSTTWGHPSASRPAAGPGEKARRSHWVRCMLIGRGFDVGAAYRNRTDDLRITRVFSCVARGRKARVSFMFTGCCWWRSLAVDGSSGTSRGHAWGRLGMLRSPGEVRLAPKAARRCHQ